MKLNRSDFIALLDKERAPRSDLEGVVLRFADKIKSGGTLFTNYRAWDVQARFLANLMMIDKMYNDGNRFHYPVTIADKFGDRPYPELIAGRREDGSMETYLERVKDEVKRIKADHIIISGKTEFAMGQHPTDAKQQGEQVSKCLTIRMYEKDKGLIMLHMFEVNEDDTLSEHYSWEASSGKTCRCVLPDDPTVVFT